MANKVLVEVCCGSVDDGIQAQKGGANRIELNSAMFQGGLTPSLGALLECKEQLTIPVACMVRPRGGGFCYTDAEFQTMLRDAAIFAQNGADGIVFGILKQDGTIDVERCKAFVAACGDVPAIFHRAIDIVPDPIAALDTLMELGLARVLTSGQRPDAMDGAACIKALREHAAGRIEILACGVVHPNSINALVEATGCDQVHFARTADHADLSCNANPLIHFYGPVFLPETTFAMTDAQGVAEMIGSING